MKEQRQESRKRGIFLKVNKDVCELEGPYECPGCGGHMMLDATFLDQVHLSVTCPYCLTKSAAPEDAYVWSEERS